MGTVFVQVAREGGHCDKQSYKYGLKYVEPEKFWAKVRRLVLNLEVFLRESTASLC